MISHSETITKLMGAMLKVQGSVEGVRKDSKNPHFKASYASLEAVVDTIRPACQQNKLVVMQAPGAFANGAIAVETMIVHSESGEWVKSQIEVPVQKQDPQGVGSALTYAERYSLMAIFNLPPVDDDGNAASARQNGASRPLPPPATPADAEARLIRNINAQTTSADLDELIHRNGFTDLFGSLDEGGRDKVQDAINARTSQLNNLGAG